MFYTTLQGKKITELKPWVIAILAHPVAKQPCKPESFNNVYGVIDARVFLKNSHGYIEWAEGQDEYENDAIKAIPPCLSIRPKSKALDPSTNTIN